MKPYSFIFLVRSYAAKKPWKSKKIKGCVRSLLLNIINLSWYSRVAFPLNLFNNFSWLSLHIHQWQRIFTITFKKSKITIFLSSITLISATLNRWNIYRIELGSFFRADEWIFRFLNRKQRYEKFSEKVNFRSFNNLTESCIKKHR